MPEGLPAYLPVLERDFSAGYYAEEAVRKCGLRAISA
jgi:hypothetical protein